MRARKRVFRRHFKLREVVAPRRGTCHDPGNSEANDERRTRKTAEFAEVVARYIILRNQGPLLPLGSALLAHGETAAGTGEGAQPLGHGAPGPARVSEGGDRT